MKQFQYQLLRYIHDYTTGEFVNVGVVVYEPKSLYLNAEIISTIRRISCFFTDANGTYLHKVLKAFKKGIQNKEQNYREQINLDIPDDLARITNEILPRDDSSLVAGEVQAGLDIDMDQALSSLFEQKVNRYIKETDSQYQSDQEVWQKIYKDYFDQYGITPHLKSHTVQTKRDAISFDQAWKNGKWNCFQPLSLDLKNEESIKDKVYKWNGIFGELREADEPTEVYFLAKLPTAHKKLHQFIEDKLNREISDSVNAKLIDESQAENFAKKVYREMQKDHIF